MGAFRLAALLALAAAAPAALAQVVEPVRTSWDSPRWEMGLRYWASTGRHKWSHHDETATFPFNGNPTSTLTYDDLSSHAAELHWRAKVTQRWYFKGNLGAGNIHSGSLRDTDFAVDQIPVFETNSSVKGKGLAWSTFDIGRDIAGSAQSGAVVSVFTGYHQWVERANAYGLSNTGAGIATPPPTELGNTVPAISNEVTWQSWRLGLEARSKWGDRTRVVAEIAFVPYTKAKGEDSHFLRQDPTDLGPVPNVHNNGTGRGVQFELEVRHSIFRSTELGLGFRYWRLYTTHGTNRGGGEEFPLVEMESMRMGFMLSLTQRF